MDITLISTDWDQHPLPAAAADSRVTSDVMDYLIHTYSEKVPTAPNP